MADDLKGKTAKGLLWNSIQNFSIKGIQFLLMLFMARILSPSDYGTMGIMAAFFSVSYAFIDCGFTSALIRKQKRTKEDLSTVFHFNMVVSCICYGIVFFTSPWIADFYKIPDLKDLLRVAGLSLILNSFNVVQVSVFRSELKFKLLARMTVLQNLISGISGLLFAINGFGVWSLVFQQIIHISVCSIQCWTASKWRPSFIFSKESFKEMFGYGSNILVSNLINRIYHNISPLVVGKFFLPATLGQYSRAHHWGSFPSTNLTQVLTNVSFPVLSKIQDDDERLRNVYRKMIKTTAFVTMPLMFGLSAVSRPLIYVVIGPKWDLCADILQVISFSYIIAPINALNGSLFYTKGRTDISLRLNVISKVISIIVLCISVNIGIMALAYCSVISGIIMLILMTYYTKSLIDFGFIKQLKDISHTILLSTLMYFAVYAVMLISPNDIIKLILGISVGGMFYISLAYLLNFKELGEVWSMYKEMKKRKKK